MTRFTSDRSRGARVAGTTLIALISAARTAGAAGCSAELPGMWL